MVYGRDDVVGLDAAIIMNPQVWEASGHTTAFSDPLVECKICKKRFRFDKHKERKSHLDSHVLKDEPESLPDDENAIWTEPKEFNLLVEAFLGVTEPKQKVYLRVKLLLNQARLMKLKKKSFCPHLAKLDILLLKKH